MLGVAMVNKEDIPTVADFMPHFWNFIKRYYKPEDNDDYWEQFIMEGNVLADRFSDPLCKALIVAYIKHNEDVLMGRTKT